MRNASVAHTKPVPPPTHCPGQFSRRFPMDAPASAPLIRGSSRDRWVLSQLPASGLQGYLHGLKSWCTKELRKEELWNEQYPTRCAVTDRVKDNLSIAWRKLETLTKYQTTIDGQLYRAMKALRDAQQWRAQSIATEAISILPAEVT